MVSSIASLIAGVTFAIILIACTSSPGPIIAVPNPWRDRVVTQDTILTATATV